MHNYDYMFVRSAYEFAAQKHKNQVRKYTGLPYITHPASVEQILRSNFEGTTINMSCAALLHDTVEDTDTTLEEIEKYFGVVVAQLVYWLTDVSKTSDGNRATRKAIDRAHMAKASIDAQIIKLADLIDNSKDIKQHDTKFAKVYLEEKQLLLSVLRPEVKATELFRIAQSLI